jgi:hypothetical protein
MPDMNDSDGFLERPSLLRGEDGPDVEGHIHREDAARVVSLGTEDVRFEATADGPEVEGHLRRVHTAHESGTEDIRVEATEDQGEDGPDVEGHFLRS